MANLTLHGWIQSVAAGIIESVPLQDFESSLILAEDFLGTQGGWVPDDPGNPSGTGEPASGITTAEAIITITIQQQERVYHADIQGVLNFRIIMNENLIPGLDDETVLNNLVDRLDIVIQENLQNTNMEFVSIPSFTGTVDNGPTDASERQNIQALIVAGGQIIDPKVIGLISARATFNLDNSYNVKYLYTETGKVLFVMVVKYTDALYTTEDDSTTNRYGIKLNPVSYRVAGGVVLSPE